MRFAPIAALSLLLGCGARSQLLVEGAGTSSDASDGVPPLSLANTDDGAAASEIDASGCRERPAVDCSCVQTSCDQDALLNGAIADAVSRCPLPCSRNLFWFDGDGCVTRYEPPEPSASGDVCVSQILSTLRFPCAAGATSPFVLYNLRGHCGS